MGDMASETKDVCPSHGAWNGHGFFSPCIIKQDCRVGAANHRAKDCSLRNDAVTIISFLEMEEVAMVRGCI